MWGVLQTASVGAAVRGSVGGCRVSCRFDGDVVLLSELPGCRVRLAASG